MAPARVVSLVPSVTETLLAWGVEPVAVTRFCHQPGLRAVGGTKDPDVDAIVGLAPDVVVMNDEENRLEDAEALQAAGLAVHVVTVERVEDVGPALAGLAAAVGVSAPPPPDLPPPADRPAMTAFVPIWRRPWMTLNAATYGSSALRWVGVANVWADAGARYREITLEDTAARRPDVVLAPSEPYPFGPRHVPELERVAPVVLVDGEDLFWWGVRTPAALHRLSSLLS